MSNPTLKLAVKKGLNMSVPNFWSGYKLGMGISDMFDIVHFTFIKFNYSEIVYVTSEHESKEGSELMSFVAEGKADVYIGKIVPNGGLYKYSISNSYSTTMTSILTSNRVLSTQPVYSVYFSLGLDAHALFLAFLVVSALLMSKFEMNCYANDHSYIDELRENLWKGFGNVLQKARSKLPRSVRGKFLYVLLLFEIIILFAYYNANLQAGYTVSEGGLIESFDDLLGKPTKILISETSPSNEFLTNICKTIPRFTPLYERIVTCGKNFIDKMSKNGSLINEIGDGESVVIDTVSNLREVALLSERPKRLKLAKERYFPQSVIFVIKRNLSTYILEAINIRINILVETQQQVPFQRKLDAKIGMSLPIVENRVDSLTIKDLFPIFVLHLFGNLVASVTLFLEYKTVLCGTKKDFNEKPNVAFD